MSPTTSEHIEEKPPEVLNVSSGLEMPQDPQRNSNICQWEGDLEYPAWVAAATTHEIENW